MRAPLLVACLVWSASTVFAAPAADVVVLWAEQPVPQINAAIGDAAARNSAAYIDASRDAATLPDPKPLIKRGIAAYGSLELEGAINSLNAAAELVDQTGAAGLDATTLADLYLYRALSYASRGDDPRSWDDFVTVAGVQPTRVLDPANFGPRVVDRFGQARAHVAALPRGKVTLASGAGTRCSIRIDGGAITTSELELPFGHHWVDATCDGRAPVRRRLDVDRVAIEIKIAGAEVAPPDDTALLVQGRTAGSKAMLLVTVRPRSALLRRLGIDGKEQDRQTITLHGTDRDRGDLVAAVNRMLAPPEPTRKDPWYKSRWVWAAAGGVVIGAILLPFALRNDGNAPEVIGKPQFPGDPW
ncbi:MAG: hypothetical protein M4D80_27485 [Myxococcota bacterium]|nr:hypothetical protein [Deltaproteobacteria bacterium]MDQ3338924.1 hypothetical protein [Myxococcota bacterium]